MKQKYFLFAVAIALCCSSSLYAGDQTESLYFNGQLSEPETYFLSDDDSHIDGFYYKTAIESGSFSLTHYWYDGFGGGFTYSNGTDLTSSEYDNLSAFAGTGQAGDTYLISNSNDFTPAEITFTDAYLHKPVGAYFTNATFTALTLLEGNAFSKKFGGETGTDEDWFLLMVTGYDADGSITNTVDFYLADYRFEDSAEDYIVKDWTWVDLTPLGEVSKLGFSMTSSDYGDYGMNTPSYFCMDGLKVERGSLSGMEIPSFATGEAYYSAGGLCIGGLQGSTAYLYTIEGKLIQSFAVDTDEYHVALSAPTGVYLLKVHGSHPRTFKIAID